MSAMTALTTGPVQSALHAAGPAAHSLRDVTLVLTIGAAVLLVAVMVLLAFAVRRQGAIRPRLWVLGGGVAFPVVVLAALFAYSEHERPAWRPVPPPDALIIAVTGRMWWWEVRYEDRAGGHSFITANEVRMPAGRPVFFALTSGDVIHSFWVPALGGKMDMVPGRLQHLLLQADEPGRWRGQCTEYCGTQHARMALDVVVLPPAEFDAWIAAQTLPAAASPTVAAGRVAFLEARCDACHVVRGATGPTAGLGGDGERLGPDLTHVGSRLSIGAATLANTEENMRRWVAHTQNVKPGARMPAGDGRIDSAAIDQISHWLNTLK